MIIFAVIGGVNLLLGICNLLSGEALENGVLNYHSVNLFCGLLFVEILAVLLLKHVCSGREQE